MKPETNYTYSIDVLCGIFSEYIKSLMCKECPNNSDQQKFHN